MERIYNKENAKKKMEKSVSYYQVRIEAWEKVKRVYKKDGSNFKVLSKNFEGCTFYNEYSLNKCGINFYDPFEGYTCDWITYSPETETPDSIEKKINGVIENYKKWLDRDLAGLEAIEKQIDHITPLLEELKNYIKQSEEETNTHYVLKSYVKNYLGCLND